MQTTSDMPCSRLLKTTASQSEAGSGSSESMESSLAGAAWTSRSLSAAFAPSICGAAFPGLDNKCASPELWSRRTVTNSLEFQAFLVACTAVA